MRFSTPLTCALASASLLALSACSKAANDAATPSGPAAAASDAASVGSAPASSAGNATKAPGLDVHGSAVAFTYRYAFTLPAAAIADVQQQHATACEKLGPQRCRVTGMNYNKHGEDSVEAELALAVAPELAHGVAREAVGLVEKAEGKLANADVTGDNAGGAIATSQNRSAALREELSRLEQRLAAKGLTKAEAQSLSTRADELRQQLHAEVETRQTKEASLAFTPLTFSYASEGVLDAGAPFAKAASSSWGSLQTMLALVLAGLGVALPWAALAGLVVLAWRGLRRPATAGE